MNQGIFIKKENGKKIGIRNEKGKLKPMPSDYVEIALTDSGAQFRVKEEYQHLISE